ncbi:hypothetical protein M8494_17135 [Serratia ureilytica]
MEVPMKPDLLVVVFYFLVIGAVGDGHSPRHPKEGVSGRRAQPGPGLYLGTLSAVVSARVDHRQRVKLDTPTASPASGCAAR